MISMVTLFSMNYLEYYLNTMEYEYGNISHLAHNVLLCHFISRILLFTPRLLYGVVGSLCTLDGDVYQWKRAVQRRVYFFLLRLQRYFVLSGSRTCSKQIHTMANVKCCSEGPSKEGGETVKTVLILQ